MTALCISIAAMLLAVVPIDAFTLGWTHSIEKIRWEEDWRIDASLKRLVLTESRLRGSGAGMEPPEGAVLVNGVWHAPGNGLSVDRLRLSRSAHAGDWELCAEGRCRSLERFYPFATNGPVQGEPFELSVCEPGR
jgi:hypothetical protein